MRIKFEYLEKNCNFAAETCCITMHTCVVRRSFDMKNTHKNDDFSDYYTLCQASQLAHHYNIYKKTSLIKR